MAAQGNGGRGSRYEIGALPAFGAEKWARKGGRKKKGVFLVGGFRGLPWASWRVWLAFWPVTLLEIS